MSAQLLDGRAVAQQHMAALSQQVKERLNQGLAAPTLAVVLVGSHQASQLYVARKRRQCHHVGMQSVNHDLPEDTSEDALLALIDQLNADPSVDGILIQLPLPKSIDTNAVIIRIDPHKDVDGFHPYNMGALAVRQPGLRPCTPWGIMQLLQHYQVLHKGQHAVVIGTSNIVGRPMCLELLLAKCTVTACHRFTKNLGDLVKQAELLIVAAGQTGVVNSQWIRKDAVVVDVGIHRDQHGKIHGDIDFESAKERASWITPVPGGVGPMTVLTLLQNTLYAATQHDKKKSAT
jgi:methylenetetrahydrofolate dehydrogenase (NADP+) / methenyltetrahydrofolate cyclohydrolase